MRGFGHVISIGENHVAILFAFCESVAAKPTVDTEQSPATNDSRISGWQTSLLAVLILTPFLLPLKGPGVHVILAAPADTVSVAYFKEEAARVAIRLAGLQG
jgi:hypothetical protein